MRLIDADTLKKEVNKKNIVGRFNTLLLIDNAPTVEERTRGDWIDYSNDGFIECPFCSSATTCEDNKNELHYCWNCGAELK